MLRVKLSAIQRPFIFVVILFLCQFSDAAAEEGLVACQEDREASVPRRVIQQISDLVKSINSDVVACGSQYHTGFDMVFNPQDVRANSERRQGFNHSGTMSKLIAAKVVCECNPGQFELSRREKAHKRNELQRIKKEAIETTYITSLRTKLFNQVNRAFALNAYSRARKPAARGVISFMSECRAQPMIKNLFKFREAPGCNSKVFDKRVKKLFGSQDKDKIYEKFEKMAKGIKEKGSGGNLCSPQYEEFFIENLRKGLPPLNKDIGAIGDPSSQSMTSLYRVPEDHFYGALKAEYEEEKEDETGIDGMNIKVLSKYLQIEKEGRAAVGSLIGYEENADDRVVRETSSTSSSAGIQSMRSTRANEELRKHMSKGAVEEMAKKTLHRTSISRAISNSPVFDTILSNERLMRKIDEERIKEYCLGKDCAGKDFFIRFNHFLKNAKWQDVLNTVFNQEVLIEMAKEANAKCEDFTGSNEDVLSNQSSLGGELEEGEGSPIKNLLCEENLPEPGPDAMRTVVLGNMIEEAGGDESLAYEALVEDAKERHCRRVEKLNREDGYTIAGEETDLENFLNVKGRYPSYPERVFMEEDYERANPHQQPFFHGSAYKDSFESLGHKACPDSSTIFRAISSTPSLPRSDDRPSSQEPSPQIQDNTFFAPGADDGPAVIPDDENLSQGQSDSDQVNDEPEDTYTITPANPDDLTDTVNFMFANPNLNVDSGGSDDVDNSNSPDPGASGPDSFDEYEDILRTHRERISSGEIGIEVPPQLPGRSVPSVPGPRLVEPEPPGQFEQEPDQQEPIVGDNDQGGSGNEEKRERQRGNNEQTPLPSSDPFLSLSNGGGNYSQSSSSSSSSSTTTTRRSSSSQTEYNFRPDNEIDLDDFEEEMLGETPRSEAARRELDRRRERLKRLERIKDELEERVARRKRERDNARSSRSSTSSSQSNVARDNSTPSSYRGPSAQGETTGATGGFADQRPTADVINGMEEGQVADEASQAQGQEKLSDEEKAKQAKVDSEGVPGQGGGGSSGGGRAPASTGGGGGAGGFLGGGGSGPAKSLGFKGTTSDDGKELPFVEKKVIPHQFLSSLFENDLPELVQGLDLIGKRFYTIEPLADGTYLLREFDLSDEDKDILEKLEDETYRADLLEEIERLKNGRDIGQLQNYSKRTKEVHREVIEEKDYMEIKEDVMETQELLRRVEKIYDLYS